jgi:hypothetical protein
VSGAAYEDQVTLNALTPAVSLDLLSAQSVSGGSFFGTGFQGDLGLGPSALAVPGTQGFLNQLATVDSAAANLFAFQLCSSQGQGTSGTLWLGGYDSSAAAAPPVYTPLVDSAFYEVAVSDLAIGGTSLGLSPSTYGDMILDTGTTLSFVPETVFTALTTALQGPITSIFSSTAVTGSESGPSIWNGGCYLPVSGMSQAQIDAALPTMALSLPSASGSGSVVIAAPATQSYLVPITGGGYCGAIEASATSIIGTNFLQSQLTIIDISGSLVGFAPQNGCP